MDSHPKHLRANTASRPRRPFGRWLPAAAALAAAALAAGLTGRWVSRHGGPPPPGADPFPLPPVSASPYLNTGPEAGYVGSETCRSCHGGETASFRRTGMGRSMAEADPAREPPDAAFDHPPSKRRYQVVRRDGQLWHRELLLTDGPEEVLLAEFPMKYVIGSGRHSLTYAAEADGFLVESPVTWYTSRQAWGMSPGYDEPNQIGFERAVGEGCLLCHAGRVEAVGGSLHRVRVIEAAIACENCHGPGSLHVERFAGDGGARPGAGEIDYTIVNPADLSRGLAEAICQQCHLRSSATIPARERSPADFRPGLPLEDFRHDYRLEVPDAPMTVVGHVEQMHLSRCYQVSGTLTCLTCHNPHDEPRERDRTLYYNSICLDCHRAEHCTVAADRRRRESPENDCVRCHMPTSPTEIPHLAFTHHRIGIHDPGKAGGGERRATGPGVLRPFLDLSRLGPADREWSLGLGYLEVANREHDPAAAQEYRRRALDLLAGVRAAGLRDPTLDASLARLRFDLGLGEILPLTQSALAHPGIRGQDRCNVLFLAADAHAARGRYRDAAAALHELTGLRRHAVDWLLLADCRRALGDDTGTVKALTAATRINPRLWKAHLYLADHYRRQGDGEKADWHRRRAVP